MARAAQLAEFAQALLCDEEAFRGILSADGNRKITRGALSERAAKLGFSPLEISAAVDQALKDAGTTP